MQILLGIRCILHFIVTLIKLLVGYKVTISVWLYRVDQTEHKINMTLPYSRGLACAVLQELNLYTDEYKKLLEETVYTDPSSFTMVGVAHVNGFDNRAVKDVIPIPTSIYDEIEKCCGYDVMYNLDVSPPVEVVFFLEDSKEKAETAADTWRDNMINRQIKQSQGAEYGTV